MAARSGDIATQSYLKAHGVVYDKGGVLSGLGGIKATSQDEIILPPDITSKLLSPVAGDVFERRLAEMGFMYGARKDLPNTFGGNVNSKSTNDHYGDVYQIGSMTYTEERARRTSVYDAAQAAKTLALHNSTN